MAVCDAAGLHAMREQQQNGAVQLRYAYACQVERTYMYVRGTSPSTAWFMRHPLELLAHLDAPWPFCSQKASVEHIIAG